MNRFSEQEIIDGIRRRDNRVLSYVYKSHYSAILNLVLTNSGSEDDAQDIFQETLIVVFKHIREKADFTLTSGFQTYLYSIARLLWLKAIRVRKSDQKKLNESHPYIDFEPPKPFNDQDIRYSLYQRAFITIPEDCQQILRLTVEGVSQKDIAEQLGYRSENYIKKRKHFCKQYLINKIKEDPEFEDRNDNL